MRWVDWTAVVLAAYSLTPRAVLAVENPNEVSFKLYRGYAIVVRGSVGNLKNLNFLVDTGAVPSVLDQRVAQRLHLTGNTGKLSVFTKKMDTERAVAPKVEVGPLRAAGLPVVVRDLSFVEDALGTRVDAMIGFDFLSQGPFTINYETKKIVFGPIDSSLTAVPYEAHPGYALVELKIQQQSLSLLVDTGASDLVLFASATRDFQDAIRNVGPRAWSNMGGEIRVQQVQLKDAFLGPMPWGAQDVFILPDGPNPPAGLRGLLGVSALKARRVGFDPHQSIIAWDREGGPEQITKAAR
jgi:predicted aspartyl protease